MTDAEKRIEQLETQAAEAALLAKLACEPATRTYNTMVADDLLALARTFRTQHAVGNLSIPHTA
jgi:hypothetical protein